MYFIAFYALASLAAFQAYRQLSRCPSQKPKVFDANIKHAQLAPNPRIPHTASATTTVRVETDTRRHAQMAVDQGLGLVA